MARVGREENKDDCEANRKSIRHSPTFVLSWVLTS